MTTKVVSPPPWAAKVQEALDAQGHTRLWLSETLGISKGQMTHILDGKRNASRQLVEQIARALGIPASWLTDAKAPEQLVEDKAGEGAGT